MAMIRFFHGENQEIIYFFSFDKCEALPTESKL